jgi:hypothetical protein
MSLKIKVVISLQEDFAQSALRFPAKAYRNAAALYARLIRK